jgi:succinoglycan biosynthesis protein ExoA
MDMPKVSIIIPCFNEQATIQLVLTAIYEQSFPRDSMEVIIADGMSTDDTRINIKLFQDEFSDLNVTVLDNPKRNIPSGLNCAIKASSGEFVIRLDAHSVPSVEYVDKCVEALESKSFDMVGGIWKIKPSGDGWIARSIAYAASHPLGVGDARYRIGSDPQEVDTVPFGAFRRSLIEGIGLYNESLLANEDYEFNVRIRKRGGVVWLNPEIWSIYLSRSSYCQLARQYWRYGYWKFKMLLEYPTTFRWRQLAGLFVLSWIILGILSIWMTFACWLFAFEAFIYGSALLISGLRVAIREKYLPSVIGLPIAIAIMHFSWGSAFLWSVMEFILSGLGIRS